MNQHLPKQLVRMVKGLKEPELHALFTLVRQRLRILHQVKDLYAMKDFQILDRVSFDYHGTQKSVLLPG